MSVDVENSTTEQSQTLSGLGVQIEGLCQGDATFEISGSNFSVSGLYDATGVASVTLSSGDVAELNGLVQRDDNAQSTFEINVSTTSQVTADLIVTSNGMTAIVDVFMAGSTTTHCAVRGVGVPTA